MLLADFNEEQEQRRASLRNRWLSRFWLLFSILTIALVSVALYHHYKPIPIGLDSASQSYIVNEADLVFSLPTDQVTQLDQLLGYIDSAEQYVLLNTEIFNNWSSTAVSSAFSQITAKLIAKKTAQPDLKVDLIIDPINLAYGALESKELDALKVAGINLIITDLDQLRDPNPIYSSWWRIFVAWWDFLPNYPWLANPWQSSGPQITLRAYLASFNFKTNQRELFIADQAGQLISFFNFNFSSNKLAISLRGPLAESVYHSQQALAKLSKNSLYSLPSNLVGQASPESNRYAQVEFLTEAGIKESLLNRITALSAGDTLSLSSRWLADAELVKALSDSASRSVSIKLLLNHNDASVLAVTKLLTNTPKSLTVRWSDQALDSLVLIERPADHQLTVFSSASALSNQALVYNPSSWLLLTLNTDWTHAAVIKNHFDQLWLTARPYQSSDQLAWLKSLWTSFQIWSGLVKL
jgi:hypothetical protein